MYFKDYHNEGQAYLCVVDNPKANLSLTRNKFPVYRSMLRPDSELPLTELRTSFPQEMTSRLNINSPNSPLYVLKSVLPEDNETTDEFPMLGRKIINNAAEWGSNNLRILGDFVYVPLYWEWAEDIIARFAMELNASQVFDAVYASLYSYDREPNVVRAFYESWCSHTNTLHTKAGEWSISLWDLFKLGGLPVSGHVYDETIPSFSAMEARDKDGTRLLSRACQYLFKVHHLLKDKGDYTQGVPAKQWAEFWCKRAVQHTKPPHRRANVRHRPKKRYNPSGEIDNKSLDWTQEELDIFSELEIVDETERKTTYLAAFLSCWLCVFVLPDHNERLIRPSTFEVAVQMASGATFSLAPPVLAKIYHGLNQTLSSAKPASPSSTSPAQFFPAHYVFGWLAYYFDTHHALEDVPRGPLMVSYSGFQGAKVFSPIEARDLIHDGSSFKCYCLIFSRTEEMVIFDNTKLNANIFSYIISLRTAFLPLRDRDSFVLEPYCPTRFSRQFGFCQVVPRTLKRNVNGGLVTRAVALHHLRLLLFEGSHTKMTLPSYKVNWRNLFTKTFRTWWSKMTVDDLRAKVDTLISSVESKQKDKDIEPKGSAVANSLEDAGENLIFDLSPPREVCTTRGSKRSSLAQSSGEVSEVNFKHIRGKKAKTQDDFLEGIPSFSDTPACDALEGAHIDLEKEVPNLTIGLTSDATNQKPVHGMGKPSPITKICQAIGLSISSDEHSTKDTYSLKDDYTSTADKGSRQPKAPVVSRSVISPSVCKSATSADIVDDVTSEMIDLAKTSFLRRLQQAPYDQVAQISIEAHKVYRNILKLDGDPTSLQTTVDAYAKDIEDFLSLKKTTDESGAHDISQVKENLHTAKLTLENALRVAAEARAEVDLLEQKLENFDSAQAKFKKVEAALLKKKESLYLP